MHGRHLLWNVFYLDKSFQDGYLLLADIPQTLLPINIIDINTTMLFFKMQNCFKTVIISQ